MQKSFGDFGTGFQIKAISCMLSDPNFVGQVYDILKVEYFESDSVQWLVRRTLKHFEEHRRVPSLDVFRVFIEKIDDEVRRTEIKQSLKAACRQVGSNDLEFIKSEILSFCTNQEMKVAIMQSVEFLKNGEFDDIRDVINKAMNVGQNTDLGLDYTEDIAARYEDDNRSPVGTGWDVVDEIMAGGLSGGELGVVVAPSGAGKSWLLSAIGANAVKNGKKVLHVSLELAEGYTGQRYDSILTGMSTTMLKTSIDVLEKRLQKLPGELRIKWFPTKSISLAGFMAYLNKLKISGFVPDVIIIDYADLLKFSNTKDKHQALADLYEELRGVSGELGIPVWTASQANREGMNSDVIEADKISASYGKIFTCDFVVSLSRKASDKLANTGRLHVIKNRLGPDGITFPMSMDTNRGIIKMFSEKTTEGHNQKKKMVSDSDYNKGMMKQKYFAMQNKSPDFNNKNSF